VHHADGTKSAAAQLVICQDAAYHNLLHARMRIVRAGGNPNTDRVCSACRTAKPRTDFSRNRLKRGGGLCDVCRVCRRTQRKKVA
jgi:hypothetical protein